MHDLKSPSKIKMSYLHDSESILSERESRCDSILTAMFMVDKQSLMNVFVNFLIIKNKECLAEENSCFVIPTNYLNECLCRHCTFPNEYPFPGLRGALI